MLAKKVRELLESPGAMVWVPLTVFTAVCVAEILAACLTNQGRYIYTLDDAYIHLSLAENIARGGYGINLAEPSAPGSSILWPYLLAPLAALHVEEYAPLVVNYLASVGTLVLAVGVLRAVLAPDDEPKRRPLVWAGALVFAIAVNLVGLTLTGMEHSLQLFLSAAIAVGLVHEARTGRAAPWLFAAIALGPLVRYEVLALSAPALLYLLSRRHVAASLVTAAACLAALIAFSAHLHSLGLGWLPTSVVARAGWFGPGADPVSQLQRNLYGNLGRETGALMVLEFLLFLAVTLFRSRDADRSLASGMGLAVLLHLLVGRFGYFSRYEIYIWGAALLVLLYLYARPIAGALNAAPRARVALFTGLALVLLGWEYMGPLLASARASSDIYLQQYQMHRFVTAYYRAPVAVNDIGWVSYRNDEYVLDLYGLASLQALNSRMTGAPATWMNDLVHAHNVRLAMIYDGWFGEHPSNWIALGVLSFASEPVMAADNQVAFYAMDAGTFVAAKAQLVEFQKTLPPGATFAFADAALRLPGEVPR